MLKGQIISGSFDRILMRQKQDMPVEIGELLVTRQPDGYMYIFQVVDIYHGSQISQANIEMISGMSMEEQADIELMDKHLRYYSLAELKSILAIDAHGTLCQNKRLAPFFSDVYSLAETDITFLTKPMCPLFIGHLRSGSRKLEADLSLNGQDVLSHHILVAATTGRGKSNLTSCMLWSLLDERYAGVLVLDPHDEYYGRHALGMKDHPHASHVSYYTPYDVPVKGKTLCIHLGKLRPEHFSGAITLTDAQQDALYGYYKRFKESWVEELMLGDDIRINDRQMFHEGTIAVLRRKIMHLLGLTVKQGELFSTGIFQKQAGMTTIQDICADLEQGKVVIIDTSHFSGSLEILVGSMITSEIFRRYRKYKRSGELQHKPVISVVLEEAPRVLGKDIIERGPNVFSSIAKEGRKFKIGLFAITQLPSLIPKDILANMNTKIILGIEMASERQAIIDSAAQDLSSDNRAISSLNKGEAIITSNFAKFATPVSIPYFPTLAKKLTKDPVRRDFSGVLPE